MNDKSPLVFWKLKPHSKWKCVPSDNISSALSDDKSCRASRLAFDWPCSQDLGPSKAATTSNTAVHPLFWSKFTAFDELLTKLDLWVCYCWFDKRRKTWQRHRLSHESNSESLQSLLWRNLAKIAYSGLNHLTHFCHTWSIHRLLQIDRGGRRRDG